MPLPAQDHLAVLDLVARYNWAIDHGDADGWAACFTDDGVFDSATSGVSTGPDELVKFASGFNERLAGLRHWVSNVVVVGDGGDEAAMRCYLLLVDTRTDPPAFLRAGEYDDRLRRVDGEWRFASRRVR